MHRIRRHMGDGKFLCSICDEPVRLEDAKVDDDGHAVHDRCYLNKISGKIPPKLKKPSANEILGLPRTKFM